MLGNKSGFAALVKKEAPNVTVTHCMLHRHALAAKSLPLTLKEILSHCVKMVTFIRSLLLCFICHIPPFTRKRIVSLYFGQEVRTRLGAAFFEVYGPPVFHIKVGRPAKCLAHGHNKRTCRLDLHNLP